MRTAGDEENASILFARAVTRAARDLEPEARANAVAAAIVIAGEPRAVAVAALRLVEAWWPSKPVAERTRAALSQIIGEPAKASRLAPTPARRKGK